jgi:hypothetical protein
MGEIQNTMTDEQFYHIWRLLDELTTVAEMNAVDYLLEHNSYGQLGANGWDGLIRWLEGAS